MSGTQGRGGRKQAARPGREKTAGAGRKKASTGTADTTDAADAVDADEAPDKAPGGTAAKRRSAGGRAAGRKSAGAKAAGADGAKDDGAAKAAEERGPRPPRVTAAAVLTAVEGLVIAALGAYELVLGIVGEPDSTRQAVFGGLTVLALAALPLAAAHGLRRQRSWSRGPSLITQILALPVAFAMASAGGVMLPLGLAVGAVAVVTLVCLLSPSSAEALGVGPSRTA
ncbi:hypothetical protein GCM10010400_23060 [Streptomyces aculeolatus]|nr:hypothetical protein [Streptomyces aculeolatus]